MRRTIALDGSEWRVRGYLGIDAALRAAARPGPDDRPGWLPASVPGSVLDDLWRAGEVPDPYVERNSLACEWVPERSWVYRRAVEAPTFGQEERAFLRFDGLDHSGSVFLDGELVGRHDGMFVPFELDLSDRLRDGGSHDLAVVIDPAPPSEPQVGRTSRVRVHKSRMTYGWDFCPRMVHQGLWQSIALEVCGGLRILDVWARPHLRDDLARATVEVRIAVEAVSPQLARLEAELAGPSGGQAVGRAATDADLPVGRSEVGLELVVAEPALWWPNGAGPAAVHRLTVRAGNADGVLDDRTVPLGFRRVELVPNEGARTEARPWTWVVNGRRTYVRGWNWVPADALYGVPRPARLAHLLRLAQDARVNLLRVWGGGLIETRAFYDECDARGLMVWQELSQSSSGVESTPADDPAFVETMRGEAEAIVPLRRNHPSLVAWCGGNELEGPDGPLEDAPVLTALSEVVERLDPGRHWLPTSPSGPRFHNRLDVIEADPGGLHDVHGPWEHQGLRAQYQLYDRGTSRFNSEFGVEGMANRRTHEALIPAPHRWPATRENPVYVHLGDWWNNEPLVQEAFGGRLRDLETLRRASHFLQAEGLRYAVEANRRRAFRNSGSIPWQFNESYPNAWCTAAVDHRGDPKPAYHAVARAYAPVVVCAAFDGAAWAGRSPFEAAIWAWSEAGPVTGAPLRASLLDLDGGVVAETTATADLPDGSPVELARLVTDAALPALFVLDLSLGDLAGARYLLSGGPDFAALLDVAPASLEVDVAADGDAWRVRASHRGGPAALGLRVEDDRPIEAVGWAEPSDGGVDLLPGETWALDVRWADAPSDGRRLRLGGWNVADLELEAPR
jgi:beta-mannosidase